MKNVFAEKIILHFIQLKVCPDVFIGREQNLRLALLAATSLFNEIPLLLLNGILIIFYPSVALFRSPS